MWFVEGQASFPSPSASLLRQSNGIANQSPLEQDATEALGRDPQLLQELVNSGLRRSVGCEAAVLMYVPGLEI